MITQIKTQCVDIKIVSSAINYKKLSAEINTNDLIKVKIDQEILDEVTVVRLDDINLLSTHVSSYYVTICILICDEKNISIPPILKNNFDSIVIVSANDAYKVTSNLVYFMHGLSTLIGLDLADINSFFKSSGDVRAVIGKGTSIQLAFNKAVSQFSDHIISKATNVFISFTYSSEFTYNKMAEACATLSEQLPEEADFGSVILGVREDENKDCNDVMLILSV